MDTIASTIINQNQVTTAVTTGDSLLNNLSSLRLSQDFSSLQGVKKILNVVPVRKPDKQSFVRVHPGADYRLSPAALIELKEEGEHYLVLPQLYQELAGDATVKALFLGCTRQGSIFIWPVKLPDAEGNIDSWSQSALEAAKHAEKAWVRVVANRAGGAYDLYEATGNLPEPQWPDLPFDEILKIAFKGKVIDSLDHPVVRKLQGAS